jgi:NhaA family Na+:H+ antiporter
MSKHLREWTMAAIILPKRFKKARPHSFGKVIRPFREFIELESSSGIIILAFVLTALVWINSPLNASYEDLWETEVTIVFGGFELSKTLLLWINDFLMAIFFLLVGLEIKREILIGELSSFKDASVPIIAAVGGMICPAVIYMLFNPPNSDGFNGWAIPMSTDIAIALGILMLFGKRVPFSLKVFLTTLAIADDIGAVVVIGLFYSAELHLEYLFIGCLLFLLLFGLNRVGIRYYMIYALFGLVFWFVVLKSGIHATIAGILLATTIPATTMIDFEEFQVISSGLVNKMNQVIYDGDPEGTDLKFYQSTLKTLEVACHDAEAPLQRLEHLLAPYAIFLIIPLFALANAGVTLEGDLLEILLDPITLGIFFGLVIGKPLGIFSSVWICDRLGIIEVPKSLTWHHILGVGCLAGIGFTMSMFVSSLTFTDEALVTATKVGILLASLASALLGTIILTKAARIQRY